MPKGLVVAAVQADSIAAELEVIPGDRVLAVNGQEVRDIIDFQYFTAEEEFELLVEKENGELWELEIERQPGEFLGLTVEGVGAEGLKYCRNNCIFCFVAQMPKGLRQTLYSKDDDYRLSLSQGSFITLSNLNDQEFKRIVQMHLSPLYISVHAWNPDVRAALMKNPKAGDLPGQLKQLVAAGITIHTQIVLIPGHNDGAILKETVENLASFYPSVQSIAVVPVGLTKYRESLTPLRVFSPSEAREILRQGHEWQRKFQQETGLNLVYFSDEFYVLAGWSFPEAEAYDGFPQLENGVGMAAKFTREIESGWGLLPTEISPRCYHLITGTSAQGFFAAWRERLEKRIDGLKIVIHPIGNEFFGETVTVAGLVTARDIAAQLGDLQGEPFLVPRVMLKSDEDIFLDDHSMAWLEQQTGGKAVIVENNGIDFLKALLNPDWEVENGE